MSECKVPWCSNDATDIIGAWWHSRFCDEHISTLEQDSCVYIYLHPSDINSSSFDALCRKFVESIRGSTVRDTDVVTAYDVEKMRYAIFFDVNALRKKFNDQVFYENKIFIEKEMRYND